MPRAYTLSTVKQIWDDTTGERIEVGPDADGLDLYQITYISSDGKRSTQPIVLDADALRLLGQAIEELLGE